MKKSILIALTVIIPNTILYHVHTKEMSEYFSHFDSLITLGMALVAFAIITCSSAVIVFRNKTIRANKLTVQLTLILVCTLLAWTVFYFSFDPGPCCSGG